MAYKFSDYAWVFMSFWNSLSFISRWGLCMLAWVNLRTNLPRFRAATSGFDYMCHQWRMDLQHVRGNAVGWQQLKRQRSPQRDNRPLKKIRGTENVATDNMTSKSWLKTAKDNIHGLKKLSPKFDRENIEHTFLYEDKSSKELQIPKESSSTIPSKKMDKQMTFTRQEIECDLDMEDIMPININVNFNKVPVKFCDDRMFVDFVENSDNRGADSQVEDTSKQEDDNFKELSKPLNEMADKLGIKTKDVHLQLLLVGMKLQLLGMRMSKIGSDEDDVPDLVDDVV